MQYVALKPLKLPNRTANIGELVPEALKWKQTVVRAHLNMHMIKEVPGEASLEDATGDSPSITAKKPSTKQAKKGKGTKKAVAA